MSFKCEERIDLFCNVCGLFTPKPKQVKITPKVEAGYLRAFSEEIRNNVPFAPKKICNNCYTTLVGTNKDYGQPKPRMLWEEPNDDHTNCYVCLTPSFVGYRWQTRNNIEYPTYPTTNSRKINTSEPTQSTNRERSPLPGPSHIVELEPIRQEITPNYTTPSTISSPSSGERFTPNTNKIPVPVQMGQASFEDLMRDLAVPPQKVELAGSRFREHHWLKPSTRTTFLRNENSFSAIFKEKEIRMSIVRNNNVECKVNRVTYCDDIEGLFDLFGVQHQVNQWRLFIDGGCDTLKLVLLHNGNLFPSIPIGFARNCPEKYDGMQQILEILKYDQFKWDVIVDFKLINILVGLMAASSKYPCIYCLWDSKAKDMDKLYSDKWDPRPQWDELTKEEQRKINCINPPLVPRDKILLPPLHIKIGLVTQLFKTLLKHTEKGPAIKAKLNEILNERPSDDKIMAAVFNGPQIDKIFADTALPGIMADDQAKAFKCLKEVCSNFLGSIRPLNYKHIIEKFVKSYKALNVNATIKLHTLICHLDKFRNNCSDYSDQQGERFHQDFKTIQERYNGKNMIRGMGMYCYSLIRFKDPKDHNRQTSYSKKMEYFLVNPNVNKNVNIN